MVCIKPENAGVYHSVACLLQLVCIASIVALTFPWLGNSAFVGESNQMNLQMLVCLLAHCLIVICSIICTWRQWPVFQVVMVLSLVAVASVLAVWLLGHVPDFQKPISLVELETLIRLLLFLTAIIDVIILLNILFAVVSANITDRRKIRHEDVFAINSCPGSVYKLEDYKHQIRVIPQEN